MNSVLALVLIVVAMIILIKIFLPRCGFDG